MATWSELLTEIANARNASARVYDKIRHDSLQSLSAYLKHPVILYGSAFLQKSGLGDVSVSHEDMEGFMEVVHGIKDTSIYLVIHSPGGSPEAAESIVSYLRSKFNYIGVIVPHQAKSAATMLACASDEILMAKHSELGPIDPQFLIQSPLGYRMVPARSIINQFEQAAAEIRRDQKSAAIWYPMLAQYGPALLDEATKSLALSKTLVTDWLASYMFRSKRNRFKLAKAVADYLADYDEHKTHGRPLTYDDLKSKLNVRLIEDDQGLQDRVLTVYHAAMHTFTGTPCLKVIENSDGKAFLRLANTPVKN